MGKQEEVARYVCTSETFKPVAYERVRWLDPEPDLALMQQSWAAGRMEISREDVDEWYAQGYRFCALVEDGRIVSKAAVWRYSDTMWELAGVYTMPEYRQRGYGKAVCSCVTACSLVQGRPVSCHTGKSNVAMRRLAESLGFYLDSVSVWGAES